MELARLNPSEMAHQVSTADWGALQEARVVSKQKALETYEDIVRTRIDPALLEYSGGNTFTGHVFPIAAKGFSRIIIAYEELLPVIQGRNLYRYTLPDCKLSEVRFTLQANAAECKDVVFKPDNAKKEQGAQGANAPRSGESKLVYTRTWKEKGPGGSVVFAFKSPRPEIQTISGRQEENGPLYLYARVRPKLKVEAAEAFADRAVFLLDTSLSEHPDRFDVNMKLMRQILESDPGIKQFNILAFNVGTSWVEPKGWLPNTKEGRATAFGRLDGIVLEGATDLSAALNTLTRARFINSKPLDVFLLSDGQITWGDANSTALAARFEEERPFPTRVHCYRTGLGADNLELFQALTRRGGGIFNCYTDDLKAVAQAHRSQCFQVTKVRFAGGPAISDVLVAGRKAAVYPGGELVVAARILGRGDGKPGKTTLVVEGTFLGRKQVFEYPVETSSGSELAPRGWGEVAVASLLSLNDPKLDSLVTAYCQQFGIGSRVASFLILENANDYKRLNLEEERGKTVSGDLGKFLEEMWKKLGVAATPKAAFQRFLAQIEPRVKLLSRAQGQHVQKLLALLDEVDFQLPEAVVAGALVYRKDVRPFYLSERAKDRRNVGVYLAEARRRADRNDVDGALRVLSSIIEEYPTRGDALRLVGYRLLDMKQPKHAARLFEQVQRTRPFEPHSYRDLARSLEESGKYGLAAIQYEIVLAGTWHARFHESLKEVVREEYAHMMRDAIRRKAVTGKLADQFGERLETMAAALAPSDLRVTISWNTDATDVDLWVMEPDGTKCFYQNRATPSGGRLSQDMTQGYGPERYHTSKAAKGKYRILVHYFSANPNLLAGETHVNVVVTRYAGTRHEVVERHTVILKKHGEAVEVCSVGF